MNKLSSLLFAFIISNTISYNASSQSLAVNTTGSPAAASSIFDISSTDKGMLVPKGRTVRDFIITTVQPGNGLQPPPLDQDGPPQAMQVQWLPMIFLEQQTMLP